jgi:formate dehydrogenase major subunit
MDVTRRDFLKMSGTAAAGLMLFSLFDLKPIKAHATANPPEWDTVTTSICCYCAVGCGLLVCTKTDSPYVDSSSSEHVAYVQGDPDHPINQGTLCSKGMAMAQLRTVDGALNPKRLTQPLYRAPGAAVWTPVTWNWALNTIAARIKATREGPNAHWTGLDPNSPTMNTTLEEFIEDGWYPVNRCTGIACLGGAAHDTEECYLLVKLMRALGLVYLEHQARI